MNPKVDAFLAREKKWQAEFNKLRTIILGCGLTEELKWGQPCYTLEDKNVVLMHGFKDYCALLFMKGALLKDGKGILIQQTEKVQATRQIRFTAVAEIDKLESAVRSYVKEAMKVEKSGVKIEFKETAEFEMPQEFQDRLDEIPALRSAFEGLTPGRQRGYLLYFSQAKQTSTRQSRVEKYLQHILDGKGMDDK